jgi:ubiquinol-cytochrome c reductase cytochrome b subunit
MRRIARWISDRLDLPALIRPLKAHRVPAAITGRKGWMYVFGQVILVAFVVQIVTGVALATWYVPAPAHAWESLRLLTEDGLGAFLRGMHFYGASAMVLFVAIHMARVYLTGSYKFPRELNWITGVVLLVLTMGMAYSGQLLRWDQDGVWTVVVGTKFVARVPLIGEWLAGFVLGGDSVGGATLTRFYVLHVFVFPALIALTVAAHIWMVFRQGISEPPEKGNPVDPATYRERYARLEEDGRPYFPFGAWREAVSAAVVVLAIAALALLAGPKGPGPPPDPTVVAADPRPDWFLIWYYALLWVKPRGWEDLVMVHLPMAVLVALLVFPLVFNRGERHPMRRPWAVPMAAFVLASLGFLIWLGYRAPWVPRFDTEPLGSERLGAVSADALEGARIFHARGCQYCHRVDGEGGLYGPELTGALLRMSPEEFTVRTFNGIGDMPAYRGVVSAEEMDRVLVFMQVLAEARLEGRSAPRLTPPALPPEGAPREVIEGTPGQGTQGAAREAVEGTRGP